MQIFLYTYYFMRSIILRGMINSIALLRAEVKNEKKFGIESMAIKKSKSTEYFHYQGAGYLVLFRIFDFLKTRYTQFDFIDIGCGKGRVVFIAENMGFNNVTGIELDGELLKSAESNLGLYNKKRPESSIRFVHANALEYVYTDTATVYFFFNPFNEEVMRKVLAKILSKRTSETIFVYMNPLYRKPFNENNLEVIASIKTRWYLEALIFRYPGTKSH